MPTLVPEAPVAPTPFEPTTPIRLSEAIPLGRLLRPRHTPWNTFSGEDGACGAGAMMAGCGFGPFPMVGPERDAWYEHLRRTYPGVSQYLIDAAINRAALAYDVAGGGPDADAEAIAILQAHGL